MMRSRCSRLQAAQLTLDGLLQEEDLRVVFAPFGQIVGISVAKDRGSANIQCALLPLETTTRKGCPSSLWNKSTFKKQLYWFVETSNQLTSTTARYAAHFAGPL